MTDSIEGLKAAYRKHMNPRYVDFLERSSLAKQIVRAEGSRLIDENGKEYTDLVAGFGVHNFGHNPPRVVGAVMERLTANTLLTRPFLNSDLANAARLLCDVTGRPDDRVLFCSTGTEAVESALKLARLATRRTKIVAAQKSFHGFTLGALSVCGIPSHRKQFEPLLPDVEWVPYGDAGLAANEIDESTAAVILEPVQAEVGAIAPPPGYLQEIGRLAKDAGALLISDEVRTGMYRTGPLLGYQSDSIEPDIVALGKSLGSGIVPVSAVLSRNNLHSKSDLSFAMSASSFSGNRLATAACIATLELATNHSIQATVQENTNLLWECLSDVKDASDGAVRSLTGRGLLAGVHFKTIKQSELFVTTLIKNGLLTATAFCDPRCVLFEPPVNIEQRLLKKARTIILGNIEVLLQGWKS